MRIGEFALLDRPCLVVYCSLFVQICTRDNLYSSYVASSTFYSCPKCGIFQKEQNS